MTLLRTYILHTWHYYAHTHCTHGIIAHDFTWVDNFSRKTRFNANSCV